jgi:hypothetical protein
VLKFFLELLWLPPATSFLTVFNFIFLQPKHMLRFAETLTNPSNVRATLWYIVYLHPAGDIQNIKKPQQNWLFAFRQTFA